MNRDQWPYKLRNYGFSQKEGELERLELYFNDTATVSEYQPDSRQFTLEERLDQWMKAINR